MQEKKHPHHKKKRVTYGFTLIELLLVIVILGILIVIALSVINPVRLQRRSRETAMLAQVSKLCTAFFVCTSLSSVASACDSFLPGEIDANFTTLGAANAAMNLTTSYAVGNIPSYARYQVYYPSATRLIVQGWLLGTSGGSGPATAGAKTTTNCVAYCSYDFNSGAATPVIKNSSCY